MPESVTSIMSELAALGSEQTKKVLLRHGVTEPFFGVKVGDMKPIVKRVKKNHELSLALFATGNSDAMYLAGLIADEKKIVRNDLESWLKEATSSAVVNSMIPWLAAESPFGWELGLMWIDGKDTKTQIAGWATLSSWTSIHQDHDLDIEKLKSLFERVERQIREAPDGVRYAMNMFLISVGCFVAPLSRQAIAAGKRIGPIEVDMGETACKVPDVAQYIAKVEKMGRLGKKKKHARC
jgi:3-methyladenine DNA glycosylase AlkD